jgi:hypothetical protein
MGVTPMKTTKVCLSLAVISALAALTAVAQAQDASAVTKTDKKPEPPKGIESKSPWSVETLDKSDGYFGSSSTTIKRDMGDGWAVGGKISTPYQDQRIGGSGTPGLQQYESPKNNTMFGPVLEKKF